MSLFLFQLTNELKKMFARQRTYIGFASFVCVELLILFLVHLPKPQGWYRHLIEQSGYSFAEYFSGLTLALLMMMWTTFFIGALYLALVAGDVMAKEVEEGTLRMMLCRPVSRGRVIALKYVACVLYTFSLIFFIGFTTLLAGICYAKLGNLFVYAPLEKVVTMHEQTPGLERYFAALPLLALSLTSVTSLGFMLSCFNMKPATATIVTLSVVFVDSIFRGIPSFESYEQYFLTTHMSAWLQIFQTYIPWWRLLGDYAYLLALDATFVTVAFAVFQARDFKS
jgi:ABC-2 type transport system permease protein